jgi:hypothetical protein
MTEIPTDARGRMIMRRMGRLWLVDLDWLISAPGGFMHINACQVRGRSTYRYGVACTYPQAELDGGDSSRIHRHLFS